MSGAKLIVLIRVQLTSTHSISSTAKNTCRWQLRNCRERPGSSPTRIRGSPQGVPPFYVIAEVHFPTIEDLQNCAASDGGKETLAHAASISSAGSPIFLVAEEGVYNFDS